MHFIDLNKDQHVFTLTYAYRIKRCSEALRKLTGILEHEANRIKVPMIVPYDLKSLNAILSKQERFKRKAPQAKFELIEDEIFKHVSLIEEQILREEGMHNQLLCK